MVGDENPALTQKATHRAGLHPSASAVPCRPQILSQVWF